MIVSSTSAGGCSERETLEPAIVSDAIEALVPERETVEPAGRFAADSSRSSENVIVSVAPSAETSALLNSGIGATVLFVTV